MISCGCDPGANGSITIVDIEDKDFECFPLKRGQAELNSFMLANIDVYFATLEEIIPRPGWGIKSMCSLYGSYKACEQAMHLLGISVKGVKAKTWQKDFGLLLKPGDCPDPTKHTTYKKNIHKATAIELVDKLGLDGPKITHNNADSLLIALYRLKIEGYL